jgi:hypothetical protein
VQEHWYYDFEKSKLDNFEGFEAHSKSVDQNDPCPPLQRSRGHGGTAILYKSDLVNLVEQCPDGSERIVVLLLKTVPAICLVSVYFPCRGRYSVQDYLETLDQLAEIIQKYNSTAIIVIAGDFNASLLMERDDSQSKHLRNFVKEMGLSAPVNIGRKPTFYAHNGKDTSQIDYVLTTRGKHLQNVVIGEMAPTNTSTHVPLAAVITNIKVYKTVNTHRPVYRPCPIWSKCDTETFQDYVSQNLSIQSPPESKEALDRAISHMTTVLKEAAELAVPHQKQGKRKQKHFTEAELEAIRQGKIAHSNWKNEGCPPHPHPTAQARFDARKGLRRIQRQETARKRHEHYETIMEASDRDSKLFYKLIARQRKSTTVCTANLEVHGVKITGDSEVLTGWKEHFAELATPNSGSKFNTTYKDTTESVVSHLRVTSDRHSSILPLTTDEIQYYIGKLNTGKAQDEYGLSAEHLKTAGDTLYQPLAHIITAMSDLRHVPETLKCGIITPVYKRGGKPLEDPGSYRGITVCSTMSKVLEQFIALHTEQLVRPLQHTLQYGFTAGLSPSYAAILVTKAIVEQKDQKRPLYVATLDAQKAFDVVDHTSLLWKWHEAGLRGPLWQLKDEMYTGMTSKVKWKGILSERLEINQGVRQGGIPSTTDYKLYLNPLLDELEASQTGLYIGGIYVGSPTCADDVMLLTDSVYGMQYMLTNCEQYASKERYQLHPTKSVISVYNTQIPNSVWSDINPWTLYDSPVMVTPTTIHLGITREAEKSTTISKFVTEKLKIGRQTLYALMGAGLHGLNGLSPTTSHKLYVTYVLPRLLYGIETIHLNETEKSALEDFHRNTIRQIQHLPVRTAIPAIYILQGALPLEAELDSRKLTLFGAIARDKDSTIWKLAERQLVMKTLKSPSWFMDIIQIAYKYGLPSPLDILENPPPKFIWKKQVRTAVDYFWCTKLKADAGTKSTLKFLDCSNMNNGKPLPHSVWTTVNPIARDVQRAHIHTKIVMDTYILQTHRSRYSEAKESAICPLCKLAPEDRIHFLGSCPDTQSIREWFREQTGLVGGPEELARVVLNPSGYIAREQSNIYHLCRLLCFKLHHNRATKLGYRVKPGAKLKSSAVSVCPPIVGAEGGDVRGETGAQSGGLLSPRLTRTGGGRAQVTGPTGAVSGCPNPWEEVNDK